ncbi:hypothetical protein NQ318_021570 [Aromia moschata]|uniref:Uncharacterized protein n=1 Tax=Aromia moschata TaxID=1265417 RepID=A0AAV8YIX7_9CUCU|nr:hypothetical protein NQ318_021570 [Aromia moschata]
MKLVFSAHDVTISNVLNAMGLFEYHSPPYASTILFELKRRSNEPRQLHLKSCDVDCDLTDFFAILKPITVSLDEWENECRLKIG